MKRMRNLVVCCVLSALFCTMTATAAEIPAVVETIPEGAPVEIVQDTDTPEAVTDNSFTYRLSVVERAEGEKIAAGEEFSVLVMTGACEKLSMVDMKFRYDKTLMEPISSTTEGFLGTCVMKESNIAPVRNDLESEQYGEVWISGFGDGEQPVSDGAVLSTITFKALADITTDSPMTIYHMDACDAALISYLCVAENGGVVIGENDGDVPEDMFAPADNAVPTNVVTTAAAQESGIADTLKIVILLVIVAVIVVGIVALVMVMRRKR